jgi:hypothetical protein
MTNMQTPRRTVLGAAVATGLAAVSRLLPAQISPPTPPAHEPILLFNCDFNWARWPASEERPQGKIRPSLPEDWSEIDAGEYFDWHRRFGNNVTYCQAYCSSGYALYPSKLGPVGKGNASTLFPRLYDLSRNAAMPVWSYFTVNADWFMAQEHPDWVIPGSKAGSYGHGGFFGPETPRTRLLCQRIQEFLKQFPVDWLLLDWFAYGSLVPNGGAVQPAEFVKKPFERIIGRAMPEAAEAITAQENLTYKRAVLAEQFHALQGTIKETSPRTKIIFNVPYHRAKEELWVGHPMLKESDGLFAESSDDVVGWLLEVRQPSQRVMTTIIGRSGGLSDPNTWEKWYRRGCDFFGYAWATPPGFEPTADYTEHLEITRRAFAAMSSRRP